MSGAPRTLPLVGLLAVGASWACDIAAPEVDYPQEAMESRAAQPPEGADGHAEDAASCMTGCAVALPETPPDVEIAQRLSAWAAAPLGEPVEALEWLLFFAPATQDYLARNGDGWELDPERRAFLRRELSRTHAIVEMRVVDDHGVVRARVPETQVPLGIKQHLAFADYDRLQPFEASGTVVRVGLGHIWTRY